MSQQVATGETLGIALRVTKVWMKKVKDGAGGHFDQKWCEYELTSAASNGGRIADEYDRLIDIGDGDDPTNQAVVMRRMVAHEIAVQCAQLEGGGSEVMPDGHLALKEWGALMPAQIAALNSHRIISLQQLVAAPYHELANLPGGLNAPVLQERCRAFLSGLQDSSATKKIAQMEALLGKALDRIEQLTEAKDQKRPTLSTPERKAA
jgi:hypothetical protein